MASKKLQPFIEIAKKHATEVTYTPIEATDQHGPGVSCHVVVEKIPILRGFYVGEGVAYYNPTDTRGFSAKEGERIAFERAVKFIAKRVCTSARFVREQEEDDQAQEVEACTNLLRAIVDLHSARYLADFGGSLLAEGRATYLRHLDFANGKIISAAAMLFRNQEKRARRIAKLQKMTKVE